jgi:hypothetical protein
MPPLHHHKKIVLNFAYLHIHPGGGIEKTILLTPSFQRFLDREARQHCAELLDFIDAHVPHECRNREGFDAWHINVHPSKEEEIVYQKWVDSITPMPRPVPTGWEEVDTSA